MRTLSARGWLFQSAPALSVIQSLQCSELSIGYAHNMPVQTRVSASFQSGKLYALLGENGSGKSCLLKTIAGLLSPLRGALHLAGSEAAEPATLALASAGRNQLAIERRAVWQGYLEQQPTVRWGLSVREVVELAAFARKDWSQPQAQQAVQQALNVCDCDALGGRSVLELSAGERQRVMLARVLASQPKVLLVDEPTAGLDPRHQHAVMALLQQQAEQGALVIAVMHDIALTRQYCDDAMLLEKSGVQGQDIGAPVVGQVADILTPQAVRRVFGIPI